MYMRYARTVMPTLFIFSIGEVLEDSKVAGEHRNYTSKNNKLRLRNGKNFKIFWKNAITILTKLWEFFVTISLKQRLNRRLLQEHNGTSSRNPNTKLSLKQAVEVRTTVRRRGSHKLR
jgi:hypothetical protein